MRHIFCHSSGVSPGLPRCPLYASEIFAKKLFLQGYFFLITLIMGMLRLFAPSNCGKHQFTETSSRENIVSSSQSVHMSQHSQQLSSKMSRAMKHYLKKMIRPREFCAEFLGIIFNNVKRA